MSLLGMQEHGQGAAEGTGMHERVVAGLIGFAQEWAGGMGRALEHGTLFILGVWAICRLFPRLPAAARGWLWWLASLKLLIALAWAAPLALPVLPAAPREAAPLPSARIVMPAVAVSPIPSGA